MTTTELPDGHSWRRPRIDDAEAMLALATEYNVPLVGSADYTMDDVRDLLTDPDVDLDRDAWLVHAPDGALRGYAFVFRNGESHEVQIEVLTPEPELTGWLFDRTTARGVEVVAESGHEEAVVHHGIYRQDAAMRSVLERRGFEPVTVFNRMRIDHDGPVEAPAPPEGVVVRSGAQDVDVQRVAHRVITDSFREHFGFAEWTAERWIASWDAKSSFSWSQVYLAELDGAPVGVMMLTDQFVQDERCGYVAELGVLKQARGRGVAKHLLRLAFAADAAAGLDGTILHVDANNTTPALGLYESVGMRSVLTVDVFGKTLPVPARLG